MFSWCPSFLKPIWITNEEKARSSHDMGQTDSSWKMASKFFKDSEKTDTWRTDTWGSQIQEQIPYCENLKSFENLSQPNNKNNNLKTSCLWIPAWEENLGHWRVNLVEITRRLWAEEFKQNMRPKGKGSLRRGSPFFLLEAVSPLCSWGQHRWRGRAPVPSIVLGWDMPQEGAPHPWHSPHGDQPPLSTEEPSPLRAHTPLKKHPSRWPQTRR